MITNLFCSKKLSDWWNLWTTPSRTTIVPGIPLRIKWSHYQERSETEFWINFWQKSNHLLSKFLVQLAGQIYENFLQNILVGTHFEILRKFSEIWEFGQNYENFSDFFVGRIKLWTPWFSDSWERNILLGQNRGFDFKSSHSTTLIPILIF